MAPQRSLSLGGEASDSPFVLVEFGGKLTKEERKFIYATAAGDLKRILRFLWNLLTSNADRFDLESPAFPLFIMDTHLGFKKPIALHLDVQESDKKQ